MNLQPTRRQMLMGMSALGLGAATGLGPLRVLAADGVDLHVAVDDFVDEQLDPAATSTILNEVICCMFETAVAIDENGHVAPGIVDTWEISADGASWTLHMRGDVVFHDGTKATSDDLAFAYQRAVADTTDERDTWRDILGKEPKIDIVDPQTIVVHTQGSQPLFLALSTEYGAAIWLLPKAYFNKVGQDGFKQAPIGTGPYAFAEHTTGDHLTFKAVDYKHWRINPTYKTVTVYLVPEEATASSMLQSGQIDEMDASPETAKALEASGYKIWKGAQVQVYVPIVGAEHPLNKGKPLADVRVRQALSLAINRPEIIQSMLPDVGSLPSTVRVAPSMPDMTDALRKKWTDWAADAYRYDPEAAKKLLADAGYPNGFSFDMWSIPDSGTPFLGDLVQVLAGYWEAIGVHATIANVDAGVWKAKRSTQSSTDAVGIMGIMNSSMDKPSAVENLNVFTNNGSMDALVGSQWQDEFNKVYSEAITTLDPAVQEKDLDRLIELSTDSWTEIPILQASRLYAFSPKVDFVLPRPTVNLGYYYAYWKPVAG